MYRWYGLAEVPSDWGACVATIGEMDGVHRGHQRVVDRAREIAQSRRLPVVAITFDQHPDEVIRPGSHPPLLTTARRRRAPGGPGRQRGLRAPLQPGILPARPDEFVRVVLSERLHAAAVVVGEGFRFGHKAAATCPCWPSRREVRLHRRGRAAAGGRRRDDLLDLIGSSWRPAMWPPPPARSAARTGSRASSSAATCAAAGSAPDRQPGDPPHPATPANGVYAGWLTGLDLDGAGSRWPAAIWVGTNPTFGAGDARSRRTRSTATTWTCRHPRRHRLHRPAPRHRAVDSVEALITQMREDVNQAGPSPQAEPP